MAMGILSTSVERFSVSRMQDSSSSFKAVNRLYAPISDLRELVLNAKESLIDFFFSKEVFNMSSSIDTRFWNSIDSP